jgi:RNA polymerase sigma factor (sigma-70 family)
MEPWLVELASGHYQAAWDAFVERYRRLILATIRRLVRDQDDVMDVFAAVCHALYKDDLARLRRYTANPTQRARFSTWLVVVVRNITIDWLRERNGRRQAAAPAALSSLRQDIYRAIFIEGRSHVEAYELIASRTGCTMTFAAFLREVRETYRAAPDWNAGITRRPPEPAAADEIAALSQDPAETADAARRIGSALESLPPDVRLAVQLFVVERTPAPDVARAVGWPNAKAVYNRVYRALDSLRSALERAGIGRDDL